MSKRPVTLRLANDETITVNAYTTATDGLVVHREHRYSPSKKAHRETSKWSVTHANTGTAILLPSQMLSTRMEAMALAERLADINWLGKVTDLDTPEVWSAVQTAHREVSNEQFDADLNRERLDANALQAAEEEDYDGKFGMRTEGRGRERVYVIYDKESDEIIERISLPGVAKERLAELNDGEDE